MRVLDALANGQFGWYQWVNYWHLSVNWLWSSTLRGCWWALSYVAIEANPGFAISAANLACDMMLDAHFGGLADDWLFSWPIFHHISLGWQAPLFSVLVTLVASRGFCHMQRLPMTQCQCYMLSCLHTSLKHSWGQPLHLAPVMLLIVVNSYTSKHKCIHHTMSSYIHAYKHMWGLIYDW